jgi:hypothetical protein
MIISPYECSLNNFLSTSTILPLNKTFAACAPPASLTILSTTVPMELVLSALAIQRPILHARESVLRTP